VQYPRVQYPRVQYPTVQYPIVQYPRVQYTLRYNTYSSVSSFKVCEIFNQIEHCFIYTH